MRSNISRQLVAMGVDAHSIEETHPEFVELGLWTVVTVDLECLVDGSDYLARPARSLRGDSD
jgi:hypothetical protein